MALRKQPYLPLYVQDYLTDEKLNECSAAAQGVFIKIMCIMHKSEEYGTILLKQKDKQNESIRLNFASKLARHIGFSVDTINLALQELLQENVLKIDGDKLLQKRMIHDNYISVERSKAGKKGVFAKAKMAAKGSAKVPANTEYEYENEIENEDVNEFENAFTCHPSVTYKNVKNIKNVKKGKEKENAPPGWKTDYHIYKQEELIAYKSLVNNKSFIESLVSMQPHVDILATLEKAHRQYWSTESGWKRKKSQHTKSINWKETYRKATNLEFNQVMKRRNLSPAHKRVF